MSAVAVHLDHDSHVYYERENGPSISDLSVTQILDLSGIVDYSSVPKLLRDRGMYRGTQVHWMLRLQNEGALNYRKVPISLRPFRKGFNTWLERSGFEILWAERSFRSPYGFVGTLDLFGIFKVNGNISEAIVDIKTGTTLNQGVKFQLAPYTTFVHHELRLARRVRRIALLLKPDGTYVSKDFPMNEWDVDFSVFMAAKEKACQLR